MKKFLKKLKRNRRRTDTESSTGSERQNSSSGESGFEELDSCSQSSFFESDNNSYGDNTLSQALVDLNLKFDMHTRNDDQGTEVTNTKYVCQAFK